MNIKIVSKANITDEASLLCMSPEKIPQPKKSPKMFQEPELWGIDREIQLFEI